MSKDIRICIIGAGGSYTSELINGILEHSPEELPVSTINLYDISEERLKIVGELSKRMVAASGREIRVSYGTEMAPMLEGINFAVTQVRVGGMDARYLDESIPMKYGIIGQETTGPGGMFKALRTIPKMIDIANKVAEAAPDAFVLNYTNPSGIISEAVARHTKAKLIGLCSGIPGIMEEIHGTLDGQFPNLKMYCVGLNHLGFIHKFLSDNKNVSTEALKIICEKNESTGDNAGMSDSDIIRLIGAVPISYTNYYFHRARRLKEAVVDGKTRAQLIMEVEKEVFAQATEPERTTKPEALQKRGGDGYSNITFRFMKAIHNNIPTELTCTIQNKGAVKGIEDEAGIEIMAKVDASGASPIPVGEIPLPFRGVVQAVKAYETLTIEAAMEKSRQKVLQALLNHPLCGDLDVIEPMVDEMLKAHNLNYV